MATFERRQGGWRVKVRRQGYPVQTRTFDTKVAAETWAREIERDMDRGVYESRVEAESTTLKTALERYRREVTKNKKGKAQEERRIDKWLRDPLAEKTMARIRSADLATWRDQQLEKGLSPITVRNDLALISHLFSTAIREWGMGGLVNPVLNLRKPKMPPGRDRRLEEGEEKRLFDACDKLRSPWLRPAIELAIETGMRRGELLGLTWDRIDLKRRVAYLPNTKNGTPRSVPLSSRAVSVLSAMPRSVSGQLFSIAIPTMERDFRRACATAEIDGLRFHDLRHEATSRLFEKGLNPMEVAAITGHKTLQMLKRYTHLRAEDLAAKLG